MPRYSDLNSYITSLIFKNETEYVVVCEGESDRKILERVLNSAKIAGKCQVFDVNFESVEAMIKNKGGLGNRQCAIDVVKGIGIANSTIFGLIDREFDYFCLNKYRDNLKNLYIGQNIYFTRGHSIENYFFDKKIISITLIDAFSGNINAADVAKIVSLLDELLN